MSELINNRAYRIRTLKEIIKHLHEGQAPEQVRTQLKNLVRETDASEIAAMEEELIAEGMAVEEVQSMCDLHSEVLRDIITEGLETTTPSGHPVDTFRRENEAISEVISAMREMIAALKEMPGDVQLETLLTRFHQKYNDLMDIEKHYRRKENLLFSCLERHGITGPSKVMWAKDDEVREFLKSLGEALSVTEANAEEWKIVAEMVAEPALDAVEEMIYKEEKILFPMAQEALTEDEWAEIWQQSPEYGWCLVEPGEGYEPPESVLPKQTVEIPEGRAMSFPTGTLTFEQLLGLFSTLPVDLTFVDAEDRVCFFSEGGKRIFDRSKAIIGRKVQHCHPPKSVGTVEQIVSDFRAGRQDVAEFWINLRGKFIHIRYFAVRNEKGEYQGTLEVTQDLTHLRELEGERRLLEYETQDDFFTVVGREA